MEEHQQRRLEVTQRNGRKDNPRDLGWNYIPGWQRTARMSTWTCLDATQLYIKRAKVERAGKAHLRFDVPTVSTRLELIVVLTLD